MSNEVVFGLLTLIIGAVGGFAWYFVDLWIKSVEKSLRELRLQILDLGVKIKELERTLDHGELAKVITRVIGSTPPSASIKAVQDQVQLTNQEVIKAQEGQKKTLGKIILIEDQMEKQEKKLKTMFDVLQKVIKKP